MNFQGRRFKNGETINSEWIPRGGDNVIFRAEKINAYVASGTITVKFEFFTKNRDEPGDPVGPVETSGSPYELEISNSDTSFEQVVIRSTDAADEGLKQLVRIRATVTASSDDNWLLGRLFPPVWYDGSVPA